MVIITGTGRCGTSLLAKFCREMGFDPSPGGAWYHSVNAGLEHSEVVRINTSIGSHASDSITERIQLIELPVVKDPRFVSNRNPELLRTWSEARDDLRFVLMERDLDCVVNSFLASPGYFQSHARKDRNTLKESYRERLELFKQRSHELGLPVVPLEFPACLANYKSVHQALVSHGGLQWDYETGQRTWQRIINPALIHHT